MNHKRFPFPDENIDPEIKKEKNYALEFCKAAWYDAETHLPNNCFYKAKEKYDQIRQYMLGRQPIDDYKKIQRVDEEDDTTLFPMDFSILRIVPNRRAVAIGKMAQRNYRPSAIAVDALAKDEMDLWYAEQKAKLLIRDQIKNTNPELLESPELSIDQDEPADMDELEMEVKFGGTNKRKLGKEAEMAIRLAFFWNKVPDNQRIQQFRNLFDWGWAIAKDDIGADNKPKARVVDPRRFVTNFCRRSDMSDMKFAGEVYEVTFDELEVMMQKKLSDDERSQIENDNSKLFTGINTQTYNGPISRSDDRNKVRILDLAWYSTDTLTLESGVNKFGNPVMTFAEFKKSGDKYIKKVVRNVYQGKWIVGTDMIFDYGLMGAQKRAPWNLADVLLPYHVYGVDIHEMQVNAIGESLIPMADSIQVGWLKIQSIRNQMIPYGFDIDLDALEDVSLGAKKMTSKQVLDLFFSTGVLIGRRKDASDRNPNYRAIQSIENRFGQALSEAWNDFTMNINLIREVTGFNELTDGSTPNPKTLIPVAKMAYEATNNALYGIIKAEKDLLFSLAEAMVIRIKQAIRRGPVEGYIPALGTGSVEYIKISPDISDRDYAIILEDIPLEEEKGPLMEQMAVAFKNGQLTAADILYIKGIDNIKQAEEILAHRIAKREEMMHQREMEKITSNHKGQQESNQVAAMLEDQNKSNQLERELALEAAKGDQKIREIIAKGEIDKEIAGLKNMRTGSV